MNQACVIFCEAPSCYFLFATKMVSIELVRVFNALLHQKISAM